MDQEFIAEQPQLRTKMEGEDIIATLRSYEPDISGILQAHLTILMTLRNAAWGSVLPDASLGFVMQPEPTTSPKYYILKPLQKKECTVDKYRCHVEGCNFRTDARSSLPTHMMSHVPRNLRCNTCGKGYSSWQRLREHIKKSDNECCHELEVLEQRCERRGARLSTGVAMPVRDNRVRYVHRAGSLYTTIGGLRPPATRAPELASSFLNACFNKKPMLIVQQRYGIVFLRPARWWISHIC
ncbi:predicted protein [Postia placenta Mad-698-R]|uniref:C2H2-type domain-containing protein n=1 Tax=Postia placenta MAD-698-R-SB12 TaxID=670580 RepID=A0A1X6MRI8_9APHY|nr:hypothetical protein POSPLADRAFT_1151586 [Postia placenta MAD-698-R-SB12]EED82164.1 predicted protein [Postia placenta Mad-698-R]OSX58812.1 hypothetical protein POSPLADRAFT_1151586 [Postia placenta MAD-698-R-SB12]